jgi:hypothetical protein
MLVRSWGWLKRSILADGVFGEGMSKDYFDYTDGVIGEERGVKATDKKVMLEFLWTKIR